MLVGQHPTLLEIDPRFSGSASVDRETDFRKPLAHQSENRRNGTRRSDFPVFDGPYSTKCYLETVCGAFANLVASTPTERNSLESPLDCARLFFHRPYRQLPERAASTLVAQALEGSMSEHERLRWLDKGLDHPDWSNLKTATSWAKRSISRSFIKTSSLQDWIWVKSSLHIWEPLYRIASGVDRSRFDEAETDNVPLAGERWLLDRLRVRVMQQKHW